MTDRRRFVQALGACVAGAAFGSPRATSRFRHAAPDSRRSRRLSRIGLELYAVRGAMRRDPDGTLAQVRAIGYDDVELLWSFDNFGRTRTQVRAALAREGLRAPSAHITPETLLQDWEKSLETAKLLGHEYLIVPSLPAGTQRSLDAWRRWADRFNAAGAVARAGGLWLAFHNEPDHMKPIDREVPYDLFLERTDPALVRHQLDVGNLALGGGDPMRYLERHRARYWSFHLKDVVANGSRDTELGTGRLDFPQLLAAIPEIEHKPCYVEQEGPSDELASARRNYQFVRTLEF